MPCWAKELLAGLQFVDRGPGLMMLDLKPIQMPKPVPQLAKTKFNSSV
jgi:hypothetical protein